MDALYIGTPKASWSAVLWTSLYQLNKSTFQVENKGLVFTGSENMGQSRSKSSIVFSGNNLDFLRMWTTAAHERGS